MKKNKKIIIKILSVFFITAITLSILNISKASSSIDANVYRNIYEGTSDTDTIINKSGKVLGIVQTIGIGTAVIMLSLMGVKYMVASVEEKAKYKEQMVPYLIGAILLFGGSGILGIIIKWANSL